MQASPAERKAYLWAVPGKRVAVDLPLEIVDRIATVVAEGFVSEGRGIEAGGLLLGRTRRADGQTIVEIEGFEPLDCEHLAGPSFMLSAGDRLVLEARLRRHKGAGRQVVGCYRSNTRKEEAATIEDVALMAAYFGDPSNVFLLVQAERGARMSAGFLIWEGRSIRAQKPYLEFPFFSGALARQAHAAAVPAVATAPRQQTEAASPATTATPRNFRIKTSWLALAAAVTAVTAGVVYEGAHRDAPAAAVVRTSEPPKPAPAQPAPPVATVPDPATVVATVPEPAAPTPPPPAEPSREQVAAPSKPTPMPATVAQAVPPPAPSPAPPPEKDRADRKVVDRASVAAFRPPPAPAPTVRPTIVDPPALDVVPRATVPTSAGLREFATPPPPAPAPAPKPTAPAPFVTVAADPTPRSTGSRLSLLPRRNRDTRFVPAATVRSNIPDVSPELRQRVPSEVLINVRVYVDRAGKVEFAELLSDFSGPTKDLATLAVFSSRRWQFSPANEDGKAVPSQVILRYRFGQ